MIGVYLRVSTDRQTTDSQAGDMDAWAKRQGEVGEKVTTYSDSWTGTTMDRPGFSRLLADCRAGKVTTLAVWRLDRLGRTASGLTALFDELRRLGVAFVSLKEGIDLENPAGRLIANVLASVAAFETEVRSERVKAGMAAAKKRGERIGGKKAGARSKRVKDATSAVRKLSAAGEGVSGIARTLGLSRGTVYACLDVADASPTAKPGATVLAVPPTVRPRTVEPKALCPACAVHGKPRPLCRVCR